ncbi:sortase [candidate division WWE3 bacterium]|nr:sortase [candidate division WWE3 bacterium]
MNYLRTHIKQVQGRLLHIGVVAGLLSLTLFQGRGIIKAYQPVVQTAWEEITSLTNQSDDLSTIVNPHQPAVLSASDTISPEPTVTPSSECSVGPVDPLQGEFVPQQIQISQAGIDLPIIPVPLENGTWQVNDNVANFAQGTSFLSAESGNVGLFAHDRNSAFRSIKKLKVDDLIQIKTVYDKVEYTFTYRVEQIDSVTPDQVNVFAPTDAPVVTLVTCDGVFSQMRHVVRAALEKVERSRCNV